MRRPGDDRLDREDLEQPLGGAGGLRDLAADFRQRTERAGAKHGIQHELAETARRDVTGQHILRADPQHDDHAGGNEENRNRSQDGAGADRTARRHERALDGVAEPGNAEPFVGEGLQHADRADQLGRIGRRIGERILRKSGTPAHGAAKRIERQHDQRNSAEHEQPTAAGWSRPS